MFTTRSLSPVIGAEINGLDLGRPIEAACVLAIREALREHLLGVFPGQDLDADSLLAFARCFGECEIHVLSEYHMDGHPEIYLLSNVAVDGEATGEHPDPGTLVWHSDLSFKNVPASYTILYGREVPKIGADTLYANMYRAYDTLDDGVRKLIAGHFAIHDLDYSRRRAGAQGMSEEQLAGTPPVAHPLVRRHPASGRNALYVGNHCSRIEGMPERKSRELLEMLMDLATAADNIYPHRWTAGDLVVWDNRCTLHCATPFDAASERRVMFRAVVKGEPVVPAQH